AGCQPPTNQSDHGESRFSLLDVPISNPGEYGSGAGSFHSIGSGCYRSRSRSTETASPSSRIDLTTGRATSALSEQLPGLASQGHVRRYRSVPLPECPSASRLGVCAFLLRCSTEASALVSFPARDTSACLPTGPCRFRP